MLAFIEFHYNCCHLRTWKKLCSAPNFVNCKLVLFQHALIWKRKWTNKFLIALTAANRRMQCSNLICSWFFWNHIKFQRGFKPIFLVSNLKMQLVHFNFINYFNWNALNKQYLQPSNVILMHCSSNEQNILDNNLVKQS